MKSLSPTASATAAVSLSGKYLSVNLAGESYALAILKVREIIRLQKITPVPQMPGYVKGVINLRGRVVPVIDLRLKFGLEAVTSDRTCVVVVQVKLHERGNVALGLIVDAVEEVISLSATDIAPPPDFGSTLNQEYLLGMAKVSNGVKMLLDLDRALAADPSAVLAAA